MSKIVIIGANHGGTAAINTILDNYNHHEVVVYDKNDNISFLGCGMALWIGKQIDGYEGLFYANKEMLEKKGATIHMETTVEKIDFDNKFISAVDQAGNYVNTNYDQLILATGSLPIIPPIPGVNLNNVQVVKLFQNATDVINKLEHEQINRVTIIGAGYIGVELAEAFKLLGKDVDVIDMQNTCLANYYDQEFSTLMNDNLTNHGIKMHYQETVQEFVGDDNGNVTKVITDQGEYQTDMVILAIGFKPNTILGHDQLDLFTNGAYLVDNHQQTSINDVYAIGDCATVYDNSLNATNYIALASNAVRTAIVAAHNACGTPLSTNGVQGSNGICIFDLKMVATGLSLQRAKQAGFDAKALDYEDLQKPSFMKTNNEPVKIRIVIDQDSKRILGAQMASKYDISMGIHLFSLAIQEQLTIDRIQLLDIMFLPHFNQPYNYITMASLENNDK